MNPSHWLPDQFCACLRPSCFQVKGFWARREAQRALHFPWSPPVPLWDVYQLVHSHFLAGDAQLCSLKAMILRPLGLEQPWAGRSSCLPSALAKKPPTRSVGHLGDPSYQERSQFSLTHVESSQTVAQIKDPFHISCRTRQWLPLQSVQTLPLFL